MLCAVPCSLSLLTLKMLLTFALAYGSFGDLLETAKLVAKIVAFLCNGRKLSQERGALVAELETLNDHLTTLTFVASNVHINPSCTRSLSVVTGIRSEVELSRLLLIPFLNKLSAPRGLFSDIVLALTEESRLAKFRKEISRPLNTIRTLMVTLNLVASQGISAQLLGAISQLERVQNVGSQVLAVGDKMDLYGKHLAAIYDAVVKAPIAKAGGAAVKLSIAMTPPSPPRELPAELPNARPGWQTWHTSRNREHEEPLPSSSGPPPRPSGPPPRLDIPSWATWEPEKPGGPTATQRTSRKRNMPRLEIESWVTWRPDPTLIPTPSSAEPRLLVPDDGSPGLFGPRLSLDSLQETMRW
ncbi:hypothetical protein B0H17DRAFT_1054686 [Mycena rosella]|uniref:Fungal N-terminal domain-containing protein n=1 Tax=Mycena rosella TaxID=1033263 RepID=A0AAD7DQM1_MYCRO|nr:hypothetical protein B0H17DRAFT_1054686 [Mycena rosella]